MIAHEYGSGTDTSMISVSCAVNEWISIIEPTVQEDSITRYETLLNRYVVPEYGTHPLTILTEDELSRLADRLSDTLSDRTVSYIITTTRRVRDHYLYRVETLSDPGSYYTAPNRGRKGKRSGTEDTVKTSICNGENTSSIVVLTDAQSARLINTLERQMTPTIFGILLCLTTGIRLGEMVALRGEDFSSGSINICRTARRMKIRDEEESINKTQIVINTYEKNDPNCREINMSKETQSIVDKFFETDGSNPLLTGEIMCEKSGKPIDPRTMENRLKKIGEACGIKKISFNILRDTFAIKSIRDGMDIVKLSRILGHTGIGVTEKRYGEFMRVER